MLVAIAFFWLRIIINHKEDYNLLGKILELDHGILLHYKFQPN